MTEKSTKKPLEPPKGMEISSYRELRKEAYDNIAKVLGPVDEYVDRHKEGKQLKAREKYYKECDKELERLLEERKKEEKALKMRDERLSRAKTAILLTDETNLMLDSCEVQDDTTLVYKGKTVEILRTAHVLKIPTGLVASQAKGLARKILTRICLPLELTFRTYTCRNEGEVTHDPNEDHLEDVTKKKHEKLLELRGKMMKADFGGKITEGMKDKKTLVDYIPHIVVGLVSIVAMILMSGVLE